MSQMRAAEDVCSKRRLIKPVRRAMGCNSCVGDSNVSRACLTELQGNMGRDSALAGCQDIQLLLQLPVPSLIDTQRVTFAPSATETSWGYFNFMYFLHHYMSQRGKYHPSSMKMFFQYILSHSNPHGFSHVEKECSPQTLETLYTKHFRTSTLQTFGRSTPA